MRRITDVGELQGLSVARHGYIYNDIAGTGAGGARVNVLHRASCRSLVIANLDFDKYFAAELHDAVAWLDANRRNNWKRCPVCAP